MNLKELKSEFERVKAAYLATQDPGLGWYLNSLSQAIEDATAGTDCEEIS